MIDLLAVAGNRSHHVPGRWGAVGDERQLVKGAVDVGEFTFGLHLTDHSGPTTRERVVERGVTLGKAISLPLGFNHDRGVVNGEFGFDTQQG